MAQVSAWAWGSGDGEEVKAYGFGVAPGEGTPWPPGHRAGQPTHTYAFVVVAVLGTQARCGLGRRPEKPGGGLLTGGTRPGGGGGGVPFRSTTALKPAGDGTATPGVSLAG